MKNKIGLCMFAALGMVVACRTDSDRVRPLPVECAVALSGDSLLPSREAFMREVLFGEPTARTPRFDDYTPGSYHVEKLDLARGIRDEAARCGVTPHALVVLGPIGPLWAFHVVAILQDTVSYQVTTLVMPHARITGKGVGRVSRREVDALVDSLASSPLLRAGLPSWPDSVKGLGREFSYDILVVRYESDSLRVWHGNLETQDASEDRSRAVERLLSPLNRLLGRTSQFYPSRRAPDS